MEKRLSEIIIDAINKDMKKTKLIIYGNSFNEVEGMRLFINSRQDWCKKEIIKKLKELK